jgi:16S rRNA C1402 (ribose-2'-O) methylase RsmI
MLSRKLPLDTVNFKYLRTITEITTTDRPCQEGRVTKRYLEIYEASFKLNIQQAIRKALKYNQHLALVTEREILAGVSDSGIKIFAKVLLSDEK